MPSAFYRQRSDTLYEPTEATIGPWSSDHQHGGPPEALLTRALRTYPSSNGLRIVRLTIEILGPVPVQPCDIKVDIVRSGHRVELLEGQLFSEEKTLLRAHSWRFKPETAATEPVPHPFELPKLPGSQVQRSFQGVDYFPYWHALEWRFTEGAFDKMGPATVWTKPRIPLLEGHDTHGLEALVLMIDSANSISAELDIRQWTFLQNLDGSRTSKIGFPMKLRKRY